jgi:hypothetical protein
VAKDSDPSAGALDADKPGLLTGLFAEENEFDRRALWRIGTWGFAAVGALVLAVTSNQWSIGLKRDQVAAADLSRQAQQIQGVAKESQNEARRLANAVETLNSDRDRLFSRITVLEQGLDSVTGTVAKQAATTIAAPKPPPSVAPPPATTMPPSTTQADTPPQPVAQPSQTMALGVVPAAPALPPPDKPRADIMKPDLLPAPAVPLPQIASNRPAPLPAAAAPAAAPGQPLGAAKSMMGPPDPAAPKLIEPPKAANAAPAPGQPAPAASAEASLSATIVKDQEKAPSDAEARVLRTDFAVDLGGANSIGGLRALWRGLLKSNSAELAELRPIIVLREGNTGLGLQLRLAAGPLQNAAEAAKICAAMAEMNRVCETTVFDGQKLTVAADEAPNGRPPSAAAKPATNTSKRYGAKHSKKDDPPPPAAPKQESATFSSLFGSSKR